MTSCVAVGVTRGPGRPQQFSEHYDGTRWVLDSVSIPTDADPNTAASVSCRTANDCWATFDGYAAVPHPNLLHWDGAHWTASSAATPPKGFLGGALNDVACVSAGQCMTVGYDLNPEAAGPPVALVYR